MRIIIVGGGIGGLALAAGLRRHDFEVSVFDRDRDITRTGGYHITLDGRAQAALRDMVAPEIFERLLGSASALRLRRRDAFWDRHGRLLGHGPRLDDNPGIDIDRITLRTILADAVGADLRLNSPVTDITHTATGAPAALLGDGSTVSGDLLVGADGAHSMVARMLAGHPTSAPTGIIGYSGRTTVENLGAAEQRRLGPRSSMVLGPHTTALYIGFLDPVGNAVLAAPRPREAITTGPTYIWGAMFAESAATEALRGLHGTEVRDALLTAFDRAGWRRSALEVVERADPGSIAAFRFNAASTRAKDLAPWPAGPITALGDAVHATPPTAGMGAGAAIRDAAALVDALRTVAAGTVTLPVAVSRYESEMRVRGSEVLTAAMRTVRVMRATGSPLGAGATTVAASIVANARRLGSRPNPFTGDDGAPEWSRQAPAKVLR